MTLFKKTRELLAGSYLADIISDEEFVLLYDCSFSFSFSLFIFSVYLFAIIIDNSNYNNNNTFGRQSRKQIAYI